MFPTVRNKPFTAWLILAFAVASTGAYSLLTAPSVEAAATFSAKTGSYYGNGASLSISGLGFTPEVVTIRSDAALATMWKSSVMPATLTSGSAGPEITLGADGFTLSQAPEVNAANAHYTYTAFAGSDCSSEGTICVGRYTGDGTASRVIPTGFQPSLVWSKRTTTLLGSDSSGWLFAASSSAAATGSFTVGSTNNTQGDVYYYVAFKGVPVQFPVSQSAGYGDPIFTPAPASSSLGIKFRIGDRVRVTSGVNVRTTPSTAGTLLGTQPIGVLGTVVSGPSTASAYNWYQVNFDSDADGWSIENALELSLASATVLSLVSPSSGPAGTPAVIYGSGFTSTGNTIIVYRPNLSEWRRFTNIPSGNNGTQIAVTVPADIPYDPQTTNRFYIQIVNGGGTASVGTAVYFTVTPAGTAIAPVLSSVTPNTVFALQTTNFTIYGSNFQRNAQIVYSGPSSGTLPATFSDSSRLAILVPGGLLQGTYTFKIRNPDEKESASLIVVARAPSSGSSDGTPAAGGDIPTGGGDGAPTTGGESPAGGGVTTGVTGTEPSSDVSDTPGVTTGITGTEPSTSDTSSGFSLSNSVSFGMNNSLTGLALGAFGLGPGPTSDAAVGLSIVLAGVAVACAACAIAIAIGDAATNGAISNGLNAALGGFLSGLGSFAISVANGFRGLFGLGPMGTRSGGDDPPDPNLSTEDVDTAGMTSSDPDEGGVGAPNVSGDAAPPDGPDATGANTGAPDTGPGSPSDSPAPADGGTGGPGGGGGAGGGGGDGPSSGGGSGGEAP